MQKSSRLMFALSSLMLIGVFFFPLWNISLEAPQYPEGMGLEIWVNKVAGAKAHDLHNLNKLNHYIGMKEINPESIPELRIMPYIVASITLLGLVGVYINKKTYLLFWLIFTLIILMVGFYDFYMWEYEYGHNLDNNAPIKVPGMYYQPPLIGSKKLLNITAISLPGLGSIIISFSLLMGSLAYYRETFGKKHA